MGGADTSPTSLMFTLWNFTALLFCGRTGTQRIRALKAACLLRGDRPRLVMSPDCSLFGWRTVSFLKLTSLEPAALSGLATIALCKVATNYLISLLVRVLSSRC
jgi:hypothetical protein